MLRVRLFTLGEVSEEHSNYKVMISVNDNHVGHIFGKGQKKEKQTKNPKGPYKQTLCTTLIGPGGSNPPSNPGWPACHTIYDVYV